MQKRLLIWTYGLRTLEHWQRIRVENVDLAFDVRIYHDPDCEVNWHIGAHLEILHRMTISPKFRNFLRDVRHEVLLELRSKQQLRVAFFCNQGRHRSVAASRVLKHIGTMEGWDVACVDLCTHAWHKTCQGECQACCEENDDEKRRLALLRAWQQWR